MQMQMEYGLTGALAAVQNGSVPIEKISFAGELRGYKLQFPKDRLVFGRGVGERFEMFARTNKVLLRGDLAEKAVRAHWVPPAGVPSSSRRTIGVNPSRSRSCSPNCWAAFSPEIFPTRTR